MVFLLAANAEDSNPRIRPARSSKLFPVLGYSG